MLSNGDRFRILERDGFRCRYCGRAPEDGVKLHVDHVNPQANGGSHDPSNLVAACQDCNLGKGARLLPRREEELELALEAQEVNAWLAIAEGILMAYGISEEGEAYWAVDAVVHLWRAARRRPKDLIAYAIGFRDATTFLAGIGDL